MEVLKSNKVCLTILGVYPSSRIKRPYNEYCKIFAFVFSNINLGLLFGSVLVYILKNINSFSAASDSMTAFTVFFCTPACLASAICLNMKRNKLDKLYIELQKTVKHGENSNEFL